MEVREQEGAKTRRFGDCQSPSLDRLLPIHKAQLLTHLRITKLQTGLLVNFRETVLKNGPRRLILSHDFASSCLLVNLSKPPDDSRDL
jgi:hypothetical protein